MSMLISNSTIDQWHRSRFNAIGLTSMASKIA